MKDLWDLPISILFDTNESCEKNIPEKINFQIISNILHTTSWSTVLLNQKKIPEFTSRIFLKYRNTVHISKWNQHTIKIQSNFATWNCMLRFIDIKCGHYYDGIPYIWTSFNLLELTIFQLFDNLARYWGMHILFERLYDICTENCSNNIL